jgi:hypothetical protein
MLDALQAVSATPSDVMVAVFGASAGVGGLVLVFLGVVINTIGTYPGGTSDQALAPFRNGAWYAIGVFGGSLATTGGSLAWLAVDGAHWLYVLTLVMFGVLLVALFGLAIVVTREAT